MYRAPRDRFQPGCFVLTLITCLLLAGLRSAPVNAHTSTQLVKDINTGQLAASLYSPGNLVEMGGIVYFQASDPAHGQEMWKSDGTAVGTVLVKDINPGAGSSAPGSFTNVNGTLFFLANVSSSGDELWKSDGTTVGTVLVKKFYHATGGYSRGLTNVNGSLFLVADDGSNGGELWKSDGTTDGTVLVKDINPGTGSSSLSYLTNLNGTLFFAASDGTSGTELWKSDGTTDGTVLVKDINPGTGSSSPSYLTNLNGTLFFAASDGISGTELWKSDGTAAGTVLVKDINAGVTGSGPSFLSNVNGTLFFAANDGTSGTELWKSDGTAAGTERVKDIYPGTGSSGPANLTNVNGTLFFSAFDPNNGRELWKSDGTANGTVLVKDIWPGTGGSDLSLLTNVNDSIFFWATDPTNGKEALWKSDGTAAGTVPVKNVNPVTGNESPINVNGTLFFVGFDNGFSLWKSDGTVAGTVLVQDNYSGSKSSTPSHLTNMNGTLFFEAYDGINSCLWKTDGTTTGTVLVKDVGPYPYQLILFNNLLYFGNNYTELWRSDGSESGTTMVTSSVGSSPEYLTKVNGMLFFTAYNSSNGTELWKSDGTATGTVVVKDINPGTVSSIPSSLTDVNGTLFFSATDDSPAYGTELWKSDGTAAGTVLVKDIVAGGSSSPANLTNVNGTLFFSANSYSPAYGTELWKSDGTAAGTVLVKDINPGFGNSSPANLTNINGTLYFSANDGTNGIELWRSDGTPAGTVLVKDINPGAGNSSPYNFTIVNSTIFFGATDSANGTELWRSDGTDAGTVMVKDIYPGAEGSGPTLLTPFNNLLYFVANDGVHGEELWQSDGTPEGTVMVADLYPGSGASSPQNLYVSNGALYFTAYTQEYGRELWKLTVTPTLTLAPASRDFGVVAVNSSSAPQMITLKNSDNTTLNVSFIQLAGTDSSHFTLDRGNGSNGTCGPTPALTYNQSCTVNVTFTPTIGGTFSAYLRVASNDQQNPTLDVNLTGSTPQYLLTTSVSGSGSATTTSPGYGVLVCSVGSCSQNYYSGSIVTLTASPGSGYSFGGWSGACSGTGSCSVTMNQAQNITASFGVAGICGSANSGSYSLAPNTNLCTLGTPSSVTGIGPWSWSCASGGSPASCSAAQAGGIVHRSSDAGINWTPGKTGLGFNNPTNAILVSPSYISDHTIFIGANGGIYKSSNSGDSWAQVDNAYNVKAFAVSPAYSSDLTIFAGAYLNGVYKSTNGGTTWNLTNTGLGNTMIFSLAISPAYATDHTIYAGLYSKGVYKSTDSGVTWSVANTGISTVHANSLAISPAYATDRTLFVATSSNHVYKSVDAAVTWNLADSGLSGSITTLAISPSFTSDQTLFATTSNGIYKTHDRGNSWTKVNSATAGNSVVLSPTYASDQTVLVSIYGDNVYRSNNGGSSWSPSNSGFTVGNRQLVALALSPAFASDHTVFTATYLAGPYILASPGSLSFGNIMANSSSTSRQVTITNGNGMFGDANLAISAMTLSGAASQFSISSGTCGTLTPVLAVGASCSVDVTFTPDSAGSKSATLQIAHNTLSQSPASISLSGTGIPSHALDLTVNGPGGVHSSSIPATTDINCTGSCSKDFIDGSLVTLTISPPAVGYTFIGWAGACSGSGGCSVTMDGAKSVVATFADITPPDTIISNSFMSPAGGTSFGFYFNAMDDMDVTFECKLNNGSWSSCTSPYTNSIVYAMCTTCRTDTPMNFSVRAKDQAGNYDPTPASYNWTFSHPLTNPIDSVLDGGEVQLQVTDIIGTFSFTRAVSFTLRGGYSADYLTATGVTNIHGSIVISAGTVTFDNIAILP